MIPLYSYQTPSRPIEAGQPEFTLGPEPGSLLRGTDHLAIQSALDYLARLGGGILRLAPGRYTLRNAVFIPGNTTLVGSGPDTILEKDPSRKEPGELKADMDWYDWSIDVADPSPWQVGDGLLLQSEDISGGKSQQITRHTIIRIEGPRLFLDSQARLNHWLKHGVRVWPLHSLVEAQRARAIRIEHLQLEGHGTEIPFLDSNYGGAVFLHDCEDVQVRNLIIHDFNGDGISTQIVHDLVIQSCEIKGAAQLGLHVGSGSQRPLILDNGIEDCTDGLFWCWGVRNGLAENNRIRNCKRHGISTGHRDTDNLNRKNDIADCAEAAIFFRPERGPEQTSHRCCFEENEITLHPDPKAVGIQLVAGVEDATLRGNRIHVPTGQTRRAIVVPDGTIRAVLEDNQIFEQAESS